MTGNITIFRAEWYVLCGRIVFRQNFSPSKTYMLSISDCMTLTEIPDGRWQAAWDSLDVLRTLPQRQTSRDEVLEVIRQGDVAMWDWGRFMATWSAWSDGWDKCLASRVKQLENALAFYANHDNWKMGSAIHTTTLLDPDFVSGRLTGNDQSGIQHGWEVAEHALQIR